MNGTQSNTQADVMAEQVLQALARRLSPAKGPRNVTTTASRQEVAAKIMQKEAVLAKHLATPSGLKKIAACCEMLAA
jgi:hypothetical protein